MLDNDINISPLPKVTFIEDDVENAQEILGKTAFYNPDQREIVLYTLYRHPKDVLRSYAHEMIHHIQNLEDRLGNKTILYRNLKNGKIDDTTNFNNSWDVYNKLIMITFLSP